MSEDFPNPGTTVNTDKGYEEGYSQPEQPSHDPQLLPQYRFAQNVGKMLENSALFLHINPQFASFIGSFPMMAQVEVEQGYDRLKRRIQER